MNDADAYDCAIVGGGPAGMTAAVYLARFQRRSLLLHDGDSRARWIPRTLNVPGYPHGIEGPVLLDRLRSQVERYGVERVAARVDGITGRIGRFRLSSGSDVWHARRVIVATGVHDVVPPELHGLWSLVGEGKVRLCPVCDAYEMRDKRVGILARGREAVTEARFLSSYSSSLTVFTHGQAAAGDAALIRRYAGALYESPISRFAGAAEVQVELKDGRRVVLDALYIALGVEVHSALATAIGAQCDETGYLKVDQKQQTSAPGIYAAGDLVQSLSQISVAFGQAAIAASAINVALHHGDEGP